MYCMQSLEDNKFAPRNTSVKIGHDRVFSGRETHTHTHGARRAEHWQHWWSSSVLPGALLSSALERLSIAVRALFSLCAPVRLLERLFHTCARVWRDFFIQVIIQKKCINVRQIVSQSVIFRFLECPWWKISRKWRFLIFNFSFRR